jgi:5,5'-dehydrodivanillate O-demethylase
MDTTDRAEMLRLLPQTSPGTPMGKLLRRFWQPVAVSKDLAPGRPKRIRILSEDLTLYRGESGKPYLVGPKCAHRLTRLDTGWIEGENIRCMYHGWQYDGTGQCLHRPAEEDKGLPRVKIAGYPAREYGGLVFAYMGEGAAPEFDLPRKDAFERPNGVVYARSQTWDCNWFQQVENSLDAVHVSFVHHYGRVGSFGAAVTTSVPKLSYAETEAGIEQTAVRGENNVRKSNWTFPNNNHIVVPGLAESDPWIDVGVWMVPIDDERTVRMELYGSPIAGADAGRFIEHFARHEGYNPAEHAHELFEERIFPEEPVMELTGAQDYVAQRGQGTVADRLNERLGKSDQGVVFLRRLFWRELALIEAGLPTKQWRKRTDVGELPTQPGLATAAR